MSWNSGACRTRGIVGDYTRGDLAKEVIGFLDTWRELEQEWRERNPLEVDLSAYDALLDGGEESGGWVDTVEASQLAEVGA